MSPITTHVLDTARGRPAGGVQVQLESGDGAGGFVLLGRGATDADGRCQTLLPDQHRLAPGVYRLRFDTGAWFAAQGLEAFFPSVEIVFELKTVERHYHVPLLLSPFGYSTYRGS